MSLDLVDPPQVFDRSAIASRGLSLCRRPALAPDSRSETSFFCRRLVRDHVLYGLTPRRSGRRFCEGLCLGDIFRQSDFGLLQSHNPS